jgi:hypothetical protein
MMIKGNYTKESELQQTSKGRYPDMLKGYSGSCSTMEMVPDISYLVAK